MSFYTNIRAHVDEIAKKCHRNPTDILLLTVSKNHSWDEMKTAYHQGCRDFGENRVQEALIKMPLAPKDIQWHLIGTLQKNKINKILGQFFLIHSVDSYELAEKISHANKPTQILLQVNTSGEATKHGLSPLECKDNFHKFLSLPNLNIQGFMTMAPLVKDENIIRQTFSSLRKLRDDLQEKYQKTLPHLSMGMSHDYPIAIEEGATILRIGNSIFQ